MSWVRGSGPLLCTNPQPHKPRVAGSWAVPAAHPERPLWARSVQPLVLGLGVGPTPEKHLLLGHLGFLWAPWPVCSPAGSGSGLQTASACRDGWAEWIVGAGFLLQPLLPTSCDKPPALGGRVCCGLSPTLLGPW